MERQSWLVLFCVLKQDVQNVSSVQERVLLLLVVGVWYVWWELVQRCIVAFLACLCVLPW